MTMTDPSVDLPLSRPLAIVDTEWTDLDPERRRIVSIAITRLETRRRRPGRPLAAPGRTPISEQSSASTGSGRPTWPASPLSPRSPA